MRTIKYIDLECMTCLSKKDVYVYVDKNVGDVQIKCKKCDTFESFIPMNFCINYDDYEA